MNNQAKFTDSSSLSGQFRLADTGNRLKCNFMDAMSNRVGTFTDEVMAVAAPVAPAVAGDPFGLLRFAHNGDSQLGTGLVRHSRVTLEFKRPDRAVKNAACTKSRSIMSMVQDVRGAS